MTDNTHTTMSTATGKLRTRPCNAWCRDGSHAIVGFTDYSPDDAVREPWLARELCRYFDQKNPTLQSVDHFYAPEARPDPADNMPLIYQYGYVVIFRERGNTP